MSEQRVVNQTEHHDGKGPRAFPISADEFFDRGMTLRDYFAAAALTGIIQCAYRNEDNNLILPDQVDAAEHAYLQADAMLAARKK